MSKKTPAMTALKDRITGEHEDAVPRANLKWARKRLKLGRNFPLEQASVSPWSKQELLLVCHKRNHRIVRWGALPNGVGKPWIQDDQMAKCAQTSPGCFHANKQVLVPNQNMNYCFYATNAMIEMCGEAPCKMEWRKRKFKTANWQSAHKHQKCERNLQNETIQFKSKAYNHCTVHSAISSFAP